MQKETSSTSTSKLLLTIVLIIGIGTVIGAIVYFWTTQKEPMTYNNTNNIVKKETKNEVKKDEIVIISPVKGDIWKIKKKNTIKISQPIKKFYPFTHLTLNKPNGEEVGIIFCKIGGSGKSVFDWNTKSVLNYCGDSLKEKDKEIKPGDYRISITKDVKGRPVIAASELFTIRDETAEKCPENWKKYEHNVIGIKFCYPKQWGEAVTKPKKEITRLKDVVSEFNNDDNRYYNSFFIEFENNKNISLHFFSERYGGKYYPNVYAHTFGYIDNISLLKTTGNVCEYKIDFNFKTYKDKLSEIYNSCDGNIKTVVIENYQYFDFIQDVNKERYSYDLKEFAYKKLFNNYFDNLLISARLGYVSQNKKQLTTLDEVLNSLGKSKDQFQKERKEFADFVESMEIYKPIPKTFSEFKIIQGEDSQMTAIKKYYWLLTNGKFSEAYDMHSDKKTLSYETFYDWYKDIYFAKPYDFEKKSSNKYEFYVEYQDHNKPKQKFKVTMSINENKLKTLSSDEILTEEVSFGKYSAYAVKRKDKNYMILFKNGKEDIVDEGYASYDSEYSNLGNVKFFRKPKFSPKGNYLTYVMRGWEWSISYVYDIKKKEIKISKAYDTFGFTPNEKFFYGCSYPGMNNVVASGEVYSTPDFGVEFDVFDDLKDRNYFEVDCKYDENSRNIIFTLSNSKDEKIETKNFSIN